MAADETIIDATASDGLAVAPPPADGKGGASQHAGVGATAMQDVRDARDAGHDPKLARQPADEDAKLDVALDETFPTSDAPSNTQPGKGKDPAPSSGFDADAEKARMAAKE